MPIGAPIAAPREAVPETMAEVDAEVEGHDGAANDVPLGRGNGTSLPFPFVFVFAALLDPNDGPLTPNSSFASTQISHPVCKCLGHRNAGGEFAVSGSVPER